MIKNFNKEYLKYLFPQRTRLTTEYALNTNSSQSEIDNALSIMVEKDFNMIEEYLPKECTKSLDIGCGLALINIPIYNRYKNDVYLLDKTELDTTKISGFNKEYKCYNSMDAAKEILQQNKINESKIHLKETTNYEDLYSNKFDIISSFLSCGWHFHVSTYIDLMYKTLSDNGVLILDIRHNTDQLNTIEQKFELVKQIYNYTESKHTGGNIGDRYIFRKKK
jgi:SAM-dependent methyltransferase